MSTPTHTPGPWHTGTKHPCRVIAADRFIVAFACLPVDEGFEGNEERANARLIAAAPALLEACKQLAEGLEHPEMTSVKRERLLNAARAAVALAEGDALDKLSQAE